MGASPFTAPHGSAPTQPAWLSAWPRCVQTATATLLGIATIVLAVRGIANLWNGVYPIEPAQVKSIAYQVELNSADRAELLQLPGIGESLAARILEYRNQHGGFRSVEELRRVRGIGPVTLAKLRPWVCVADYEGPSTESEARERPVHLAGRSARNAAPSESVLTGKKLRIGDPPLDLSCATVEDLTRLPGIGPKLAQAIAAARDKKAFASVDELRRVKGIGPKTLEKVRPFVIVKSEPHEEIARKK